MTPEDESPDHHEDGPDPEVIGGEPGSRHPPTRSANLTKPDVFRVGMTRSLRTTP